MMAAWVAAETIFVASRKWSREPTAQQQFTLSLERKAIMENKNMPAATLTCHEWENDPNCFLRMLDSPKQQRTRAARRQKDADRERLLSAIQAVGIAALDLVLILFIICTMF
jgi:hypothetical protein